MITNQPYSGTIIDGSWEKLRSSRVQRLRRLCFCAFSRTVAAMLRAVLPRQRNTWLATLRRSQTTSTPPTIPKPPATSETPPPAHPQPPPLPPEPLTNKTPDQTSSESSSKPPPPPPPKPKIHRFRRFLFYTTAFLGLGYAGGVYYALVSDNFHDFFTEYIPFGEDAVLFFEEREFKRRFPDPTAAPTQSRTYPQVSGENKVTVGRNSGVSATAAQEAKPVAPSDAKDKKGGAISSPTRQEIPKDVQTDSAATKKASKKKQESKGNQAASPGTSSASAISPIDSLSIDNAADPVVQNVSKILNDIIAVVNADGASTKYGATITKAKDDIEKLATDIATYRAKDTQLADEKVRQSQLEFDKGAQELIARIQKEQRDQELAFREEYEAERERLVKTYEDKVKAELEAVQRVADQRRQNELVEQSIKLSDQFTQDVRDRVEKERTSRLSRLNELSRDVEDLEKLTNSYTSMIDSNLQVQHLITAVEAVRAALDDADRPKPFIHELVALKEIAQDDTVVGSALSSIDPIAYQRGIPTSAQLIDRFRRVAEEVRKASLLPEDAGAASHAASLMLSRFMFKKEGLAVGDDAESILTRTETLLEEGNLDDATREMNGLTGWARVLSRDWLAECRRTLEVRQALDVSKFTLRYYFSY